MNPTSSILALLTIIAAGLLIEARAGETVTAFTASVASYHFDRDKDRCEFNPGLGLEHGRDLRWHVGVYSNSDCKFSGYAGPSYSRAVDGRWRAGVALLGFTGYHTEKKIDGETKRTGEVLFASMLVLAYEGKRRGLNIGYIPPDGNDFKGLLFLQAKVMRW